MSGPECSPGPRFSRNLEARLAGQEASREAGGHGGGSEDHPGAAPRTGLPARCLGSVVAPGDHGRARSGALNLSLAPMATVP